MIVRCALANIKYLLGIEIKYTYNCYVDRIVFINFILNYNLTYLRFPSQLLKVLTYKYWETQSFNIINSVHTYLVIF